MTPAPAIKKPPAPVAFDVNAAVQEREANRLAGLARDAVAEHERAEAARLAAEQRQARRTALLEQFETLTSENKVVFDQLMKAYDAFQAAAARAEWHDVAVRQTRGELADLGHDITTLPGLSTFHSMFEENDSALIRAAAVYTNACKRTPTRQSVVTFWLGSN